MPTPEQLIRDAYGFDFPPDFFPFREFLAALPRNLLDDALEIHSAYPFKAADGKQPRDHPNRPHWEDRYYNDPPEFVTILHGRTDGLHWGYYFDDPATSRAVVASFYSNDAFQFSIDGDSLFEAVRMSVEYAERDFQNFLEDEPDEKKYYEKKLKQLTALRAALKPFWDADRPQTGDEYTDEYGGSAWRKPVAPTRDDMGIVIPRRLYRPLPGKDPTTAYDWDPSAGAVAKLAAKATKLLEDGFPGAALKLGKDLWAYPRHHAISYELLDAAYEALGRPHLRQLLAEAKAYREHCDRLRK